MTRNKPSTLVDARNNNFFTQQPVPVFIEIADSSKKVEGVEIPIETDLACVNEGQTIDDEWVLLGAKSPDST